MIRSDVTTLIWHTDISKIYREIFQKSFQEDFAFITISNNFHEFKFVYYFWEVDLQIIAKDTVVDYWEREVAYHIYIFENTILSPLKRNNFFFFFFFWIMQSGLRYSISCPINFSFVDTQTFPISGKLLLKSLCLKLRKAKDIDSAFSSFIEHGILW